MRESLLKVAEILAGEGYDDLFYFIRSNDAPWGDPIGGDVAEWFKGYPGADQYEESFAEMCALFIDGSWISSSVDESWAIAEMCRGLRESALAQPVNSAPVDSGYDLLHQESHHSAGYEVAAEESAVVAGSEFTDKELVVLGRARDAAAHAAEAAVQKLKVVEGLGRRWFGRMAWEHYSDAILRNFSVMGAAAREVAVYRYGSGGSAKMVSGELNGHSFAYTYPGDSVYLFSPYWSLNDRDQGLYLLHEMAHYIDESILDKTSMGKDQALFLASAARDHEPMYNAYSYHYCAEEVSAGIQV